MQQRTIRQVRELQEITTKTDTRDILSHATIQAEGMEDYFLVDIDAHVTETQFWSEIIDLIGHIKALEKKYPALDRVSVSLSVGVPEKVALQQLERFAKEVMPAFKGSKAPKPALAH